MEPKATPPPRDRFTSMTSGTPKDPPGIRPVVTRDHAVIRQWASQHAAEPATGERGAGAPAVRSVNDSGAGIRFNFPGFSPFTPMSWDDWLAHFETHDLAFVFEEEDREQVAARARERWQARGGGGDSNDDWFQAEADLQNEAGGQSAVRYRLIKTPGSSR
jgi:hypothetical protein